MKVAWTVRFCGPRPATPFLTIVFHGVKGPEHCCRFVLNITDRLIFSCCQYWISHRYLPQHSIRLNAFSIALQRIVGVVTPATVVSAIVVVVDEVLPRAEPIIIFGR